MTEKRRLALIVAFAAVALLAVGLTIHRLTQPEPNLERCAALVGPDSTDDERREAFRNPLCKDVRELIR